MGLVGKLHDPDKPIFPDISFKSDLPVCLESPIGFEMHRIPIPPHFRILSILTKIGKFTPAGELARNLRYRFGPSPNNRGPEIELTNSQPRIGRETAVFAGIARDLPMARPGPRGSNLGPKFGPGPAVIELTDEQWPRIATVIPAAKRGGRPRTVDLRGVVNALLAIRGGRYTWRKLPNCYPPTATVRYYFDRWQRDGTWELICAELQLPAGGDAPR